jgi:hypothetical protein
MLGMQAGIINPLYLVKGKEKLTEKEVKLLRKENAKGFLYFR